MSDKTHLYTLFVLKHGKKYFQCWIDGISYQRANEIVNTLLEDRRTCDIDETYITYQPEKDMQQIGDFNLYYKPSPRERRLLRRNHEPSSIPCPLAQGERE